MTILHIARRADWDDALRSGSYRVSTLGATIDRVGFVHGSFPDQVAQVAELLYADTDDELCVLVLDEHAVRAAGTEVRLEDAGDTMTYTASRRWPQGGVTSRVSVEIGAPFGADELTDFDHFVTARWTLFSVGGARGQFRRYAHAQHGVWPLRRAVVRELDDQLVTDTGLPAPHGDPLAHYSPGVEVRIGPPRRYR